MMGQLKEVVRRLRMQVANMLGRAVVHLVDDGLGIQRVQLGVVAGETVDEGEHFQPYGFSSVPLAGAEALVMFPSGDHGVPLVAVIDDRRYRPRDGEPGEVRVYHKDGAVVTLLANGDIQVSAKAGAKVYLDDGSGPTEALITKSQFDAHVHGAFGGSTTTPTNAATSGTTVVRGK